MYNCAARCGPSAILRSKHYEEICQRTIMLRKTIGPARIFSFLSGPMETSAGDFYHRALAVTAQMHFEP
jgi:hypothetical protein